MSVTLENTFGVTGILDLEPVALFAKVVEEVKQAAHAEKEICQD